MTNYERINSMDIEDMSKFDLFRCPRGGDYVGNPYCDKFGSCQECFLAWLNEEESDNKQTDDFSEQESKIGFVCNKLSDNARLAMLGSACSELAAALFEYLSKNCKSPDKKTIEKVMKVQVLLDVLDSDFIDYSVYKRLLNKMIKNIKEGKI